MQELTGYVIAGSINQKLDTMSLVDPVVYFNLADAQANRHGGEIILQIIIHYPQNGQGGLQKL